MLNHNLRQPLCRGLALILLSCTAAAQTDISGTLFDGSGGPLLSGQIYHVTGLVTVPQSQTLTVQAGAIIKFKSSGLRFDVAGALVVQGTPGNEVTFTSILDDSVGGDSGGDGPTTGAPGEWEGLNVLSTSTGTIIDHARIRYSGAFGFSGIESNASDLVLRDSTLEDGSDSAVDLNNAAGSFTLERNAFLNCSRYPVEDVNINTLPGFLDNTASGNGIGDLIRVSSATMTGDLVLDPRNGIDDTIVSSVLVTIPVGNTLQMEQGLIWKWESSGLRIDVAGALITNGTATKPVVFTSGADDDFGSDVFNDGPTSGSPGEWEGLNLLSTSTGSILDHVLIRYSGAFSFSGIESNALDFTLRDSVIENGLDNAIDLTGNVGSYQIERNALTNCGRYAIDGVAIDVVPGFLDNTASGNTLGDMVRITVGSMAGSLTIDPRNGIDNTFVPTVLLSNPVGATFQLERGTIIKFSSSGLRFDIGGTLRCLGTLLEPVVLTTVADDEVGSDVENDGVTVGAPGQWEGINLLSTSTGSLMNYAILRFSGAFNFAGVESNALDFTMQNSVIEFGANSAVDLNSKSGDYIFERNNLRDCQRYAVESCHIDVIPGFHFNRASGNVLGNYQRISSGALGKDAVIKRENMINGALVTGVILSVPAGRKLTLDPGVVLKFESAGLRLDAFGELHVQGTGRDPVVFTAFADDEYGGDTNLDGASIGVAGAWESVRAVDAEVADFDYALIRFAGAFNFDGLYIQANILAGNVATVNAVRVEHCSGTGISLNSLTEDATNLIAFQNGGVGIELNGLIVDIVHATAVGNTGEGIKDNLLGSSLVKNSVSWNNLLNAGNYSGFDTTEILFCNGDLNAAGSNGNIFVDPLFVGEANGDLNLSATSPCQDSGDFNTALALNSDAVENSRLLDATLSGNLRADMGAYERALWSVSTKGSSRLGGHTQFLVNGPSGTSNFFLGLLDGSSLSDPFGVVTAGTASLSFLGSAPVGTPFEILYPTDSALIGTQIGIQAVSTPQGSPTVGGVTQLVRLTLQAAVKVNPALQSL